MCNARKYPKNNSGFSLIELMIALTIGVFLIGGVFTVYTNGRVTQDQTEAQTHLVDDARFAIHKLRNDLMLSGLWRAIGYNYINGYKDKSGVSATMPKATNDCEDYWYVDLAMPVFAMNNANPYPATCVPNADYKANTDVLVLRYANHTEIPQASLVPGITYVYANGFSGELHIGGTPAPTEPVNGRYYRLISRAFYINNYSEQVGDDYPALYSVNLAVQAGAPAVTHSMLLPGVEDLQIQFGVDTDDDDAVNMYVDPDDPVLTPTLEKVKAVQAWVMLRSRDKELDTSETQTISMAGRPAVVFSDGYRRVVMSTVVALLNKNL